MADDSGAILVDLAEVQKIRDMLNSANTPEDFDANDPLDGTHLIDTQDGYLILLKPDDLSSLVGSDETWW